MSARELFMNRGGSAIGSSSGSASTSTVVACSVASARMRPSASAGRRTSRTASLVRLTTRSMSASRTASSFNSIPDITSRSFKGSINARDGEPSVVAGVITDQELRSARGYPGLGQLPGVSAALDSNTSDHPHQEILIVVTPTLSVSRSTTREPACYGAWTSSAPQE